MAAERRSQKISTKIKNFFMKLNKSFLLIIATSALCTLLGVLAMKSDWKIPESWDIAIIFPAALLIISSVCFCIQLFLQRRPKKRKMESSFDEEYIHEYIKAVGTYLGSDAEEELGLYKSVAANIYLHIPEKYWMLIDRIDKQVSINNKETAWDELKSFAQFLVKNEKE